MRRIDFHDARQVLAIAHAQLEHQRGAVGVLFFDGDALDVGVAGGDRRGHRREHAHLVGDVDADLGAEHLVGGGLPGDRQPVLRMLAIVLDVHAVLAMNDHAAAGRQEREDRIVRNREAAARVATPAGLRCRRWRAARARRRTIPRSTWWAAGGARPAARAARPGPPSRRARRRRACRARPPRRSSVSAGTSSSDSRNSPSAWLMRRAPSSMASWRRRPFR